MNQFNKLLLFSLCVVLSGITLAQVKRQRIKAIGLPLADHYAGIIAYERYRNEMIHADFQILILPGPDLVRAYFRSEADADLAFNVCPMVLDMFAENPNFRWVSLIHRDGNALAINHLLNTYVKLPEKMSHRKPNGLVANAILSLKQKTGKPLGFAIPSPLATHTTVLFKYFKTHGISFSFRNQTDVDVVFSVVKPPKSPVYLKKKEARATPAAFEQSLPWPQVAEANGSGKVAWYSKDVMGHTDGHGFFRVQPGSVQPGFRRDRPEFQNYFSLIRKFNSVGEQVFDYLPQFLFITAQALRCILSMDLKTNAFVLCQWPALQIKNGLELIDLDGFQMGIHLARLNF